MKSMYVCTNAEAERRCREFYIGLIRKSVLAAGVTALAAAALTVKGICAQEGVTLTRQGYGGDTESVVLETEVDGSRTEFEVDVQPVEYSDDELPEVYKKAFEYIDGIYLADNESADAVYGNLNLIGEIDDMGLEIEWLSSDYDVVSSDGEVMNDDSEMDELVKLTAVLSYGKNSVMRDYNVRVLGKEQSHTDKVVQSIIEYISNLQQTEADSTVIQLPEEINGYKVTDISDKGGTAAVLLAGMVFIIGIWIQGRARLGKNDQRRRDRLEASYPGFVDSLILYMEAGLTVRGTFARIVQNSRPAGDKDDVLGTELRYTMNEIQAGIPEADAYYDLSRRLNMPIYTKLLTLLARNLSKGTRDILAMMAGEEQAAILTRKENAKKKGEKAGTELLFPMIILLGIVMVIVVLPAVISF